MKKAEPGSPAEEGRRYAAPALEKGLDIIELLARSAEGLSQTQIAHSLGRSVPEVFRMLVALELRGYIARRPPADAYQLTMKLQALAAEQPMAERLIAAAQPVMRRVAVDAQQSVHLAVLDGTDLFILTKVDSPAPIGLHVRTGSRHSIAETASGRLLCAFAPESVRAWLFDRLFPMPAQAVARAAFEDRLAAIRCCGYEHIANETLQGVTSVSFPIVDRTDTVLAALTMPFVAARREVVPCSQAGRLLWLGAQEICGSLGGSLREPQFPLSEPAAEA